MQLERNYKILTKKNKNRWCGLELFPSLMRITFYMFNKINGFNNLKMGKFLKSEFTDRVELYLLTMNLDKNNFESYKYMIWNNQMIHKYREEKNIKETQLGFPQLDNEDYQNWLINFVIPYRYEDVLEMRITISILQEKIKKLNINNTEHPYFKMIEHRREKIKLTLIKLLKKT